MTVSNFEPIPVSTLDVSRPWADPPVNARGQALVLVTDRTVPIGSVLTRAAAPEEALRDLREEVDRILADAVTTDPAPAGSPAPGPVSASVVLCTTGTAEHLLDAVRAVLAQTHSALECVVVDNRPEHGLARQRLRDLVEQDPRLRVVDEPAHGLSFARNRGLAASTGTVVAFTDDDALPEPTWLARLVAAFDLLPDVDAVTGLVFPAALDTEEEYLFEQYGSFDKGYRRTVWSQHPRTIPAGAGVPGERGPAFPYTAGCFGSGNNMAFRRSTLTRIGGFEVALGAGTPSGGGEDLDAFVSVIRSGGTLVYEPAAVVRHHHRDDPAALRAQVYAYGSGLSAMVARRVLRDPRELLAVLGRLPAGLRHLLSPGSPKNSRKTEDFPRDLALVELRGLAVGPLHYLRGRRRARREVTR